MKYVIIGGDAAGMSAASRIKRYKPEAEVIVLEKTKTVSYSACGMPYNISDPEKPVSSLIVRTAEAFINNQGIDLRINHEALSINRDNKTVFGKDSNGEDFVISYDRLLIATGASAIYPNVPGINNSGVFVLKTLDDCQKIKTTIAKKEIQSAVIIGMGYIALEMAESFTKRGIRVSMIKERKQLLPWMLPELSAIVGKELNKNRVKYLAEMPLESIKTTKEGLTVKAGGEEINCDIVLVAIGVKPISKLATDAGLDIGAAGAISINENMTTSDPDIYAAGDCADCKHIVSDQKTWIPLALTANRGGRIAADNMIGNPVQLKGIAGTGVFKVFDLEIARTGLSLKEANELGYNPVYKAVVSKSKAHIYPGAESISLSFIVDKTSRKILGAQMVGKEGVARRINAVVVALHANMTIDEFYNCDLAYAPPYSPVWDPMLTASSVLISKLNKT